MTKKELPILKTILMLCCIFLSFLKSYSQDLEKYQWENRILLIFSDYKHAAQLKNQMLILSKQKQGLKERKFKILQFSEDEYRIDFDTIWRLSTLEKKKYNRKSKGFNVVLIGLDGGIKMKHNKVISTEKLFAIIDGMPMRRTELKKNRN